jgi:hypothetical protein
MTLRNVPKSFTLEEQRQEVNEIAVDLDTAVDGVQTFGGNKTFSGDVTFTSDASFNQEIHSTTGGLILKTADQITPGQMITEAIFGGSMYVPYGFSTYPITNFPGGGISETSTTDGITITNGGQIYISNSSGSALWKGRQSGTAGITSEIDAPGNATFAGIVTATGGVVGNLTGNVTGNLTGDVTGNLTGDVTGDLTGDVTGDVTGDLTGDVTGNVTGNASGTAGSTGVLSAGATGADLTLSGNLTSAGTVTSTTANNTYAFEVKNGSTNIGGLYRSGTSDTRLILKNVSGTSIVLKGSDGSATFATTLTAADFDSNHPSDSRFGRFNWAGIRFTDTSGNNLIRLDADGGGSATFAGRCNFGSSSVADVSGKFSNSDAASATLYVTNHNSSGTLFSGRNSSNTEVIDLGVDGSATFDGDIDTAGTLTFTGQTNSATGTASSTALDHYEEGTWSPDFLGLSSAFTTYYNKVGTYVRIGSLCHVQGFIQLNGTPSFTDGNAQLKLGPLPFNHSNQNGGYNVTVGSVASQSFNYHDNDYINSGQLQCGIGIDSGTSYVIFQVSGNNNIRGIVQNSAIGSTNCIVEFQLTYRV